MAEQAQVATDSITAVRPAVAEAGASGGVPLNEQNIESLDSVESPQARTKLRTYTILLALYVSILFVTLQ